jgi:hypothetical protein
MHSITVIGDNGNKTRVHYNSDFSGSAHLVLNYETDLANEVTLPASLIKGAVETQQAKDSPDPLAKYRARALRFASGTLLASIDTVGSTSIVGDRIFGQELADSRATFKQVAAELNTLAVDATNRT